MSEKQAGATIRTIYYLLKSKNKHKSSFTADEICEWYKIFKKDPHIEKFLEFKKRDKNNKRLKTLENISELKAWLWKHTHIKKIFWFKEENRKFKIRHKFYSSLENLIKNTV